MPMGKLQARHKSKVWPAALLLYLMVWPCSRMSNLMCASLCTADNMCNAYNYSKASGCIPGNATELVGVNPNSENTTYVFINAALVPGKSY